jgi:hypothetical protein
MAFFVCAINYFICAVGRAYKMFTQRDFDVCFFAVRTFGLEASLEMVRILVHLIVHGVTPLLVYKSQLPCYVASQLSLSYSFYINDLKMVVGCESIHYFH